MGSSILSIEEEKPRSKNLSEEYVMRVILQEGSSKYVNLEMKTEGVKATLLHVAKNIKSQILYHDQHISGINNNGSSPHINVVTYVHSLQDRVRELENQMTNANISVEKTIYFLNLNFPSKG